MINLDLPKRLNHTDLKSTRTQTYKTQGELIYTSEWTPPLHHIHVIIPIGIVILTLKVQPNKVSM